MATLLILLLGVTFSRAEIPSPSDTRATPPPEVREDLEDLRDSFFAQCREQGISEPEDFLERVRDNAMRCVLDNLNVTEIQADITKHMENSDLDVLFSSRCQTLPPIMLSCARDRLGELEQCLNDTQRAKNYTETLMAGLEAAVDFLCFKDGERIAIFLGEKGQECVSSNQTGQDLQKCLKEHDLYDENGEGVGDTISSLVYGYSEENCRRLFIAHDCVAGALKHCDDPTPSNVVDSLLNAFEGPLPCKRVSTGGAAGTSPLATCLMLLVSYVSALVIGRLS